MPFGSCGQAVARLGRVRACPRPGVRRSSSRCGLRIRVPRVNVRRGRHVRSPCPGAGPEDRRAHTGGRGLRAWSRSLQLPRRRERRTAGRRSRRRTCGSRTGSRRSLTQRTVARLETIGAPGAADTRSTHRRSTSRTCARRAPGTYWVLAQPRGAKISGLGNVVVRQTIVFAGRRRRRRPPRARPRSRRRGGKLAPLTTATHPDRQLYTTSVAQALAAHEPFVVTFATPKFCTSRTCGPVVDVVSYVRKQLARGDVRFIHVEVFQDNDPRAGLQPLDAAVGICRASRGSFLVGPRRAHQGEVRGPGLRSRAARRGRVDARRLIGRPLARGRSVVEHPTRPDWRRVTWERTATPSRCS